MLFFYLFALISICSSLMVVVSSNMVYSILWLIFTFISTAGLLILIGAEYIAMTLIIVYIGAIAVLFIFVVMMINVNQIPTKKASYKSFIFGSLISLSLLFNLSLIIYANRDNLNLIYTSNLIINNDITNTHQIGNALYTNYILSFQVVGIILLAAMISCIILTLRVRKNTKRQNILQQLSKNKETSVQLLKAVPKSGIKNINYE